MLLPEPLSFKSCKCPWYCTLTLIRTEGYAKTDYYYSDGTEVAYEYTKIVTAHLAWVNHPGIINNNNAGRIVFGCIHECVLN